MTTPCESKDDISAIRQTQSRQGEDLAVVKDATDRLRMEQAAFISESREVIGLLKEMAIEGKQTQRAFKEAQDVLFQKCRENAKDIRDVQEAFLEHRLTEPEQVKQIAGEEIEPVRKIIAGISDDVQSLIDKKLQSQGKWMAIKDLRVILSTGAAVVAVFAVIWDHIVGLFTK